MDKLTFVPNLLLKELFNLESVYNVTNLDNLNLLLENKIGKHEFGIAKSVKEVEEVNEQDIVIAIKPAGVNEFIYASIGTLKFNK